MESKELKFEQDSGPEAEEDDYIRYITQVDTPCVKCAATLHIELDVWEYPEAVANYSYHNEQGVHDIDCEFDIEHYFEDDATLEIVAQRDESPNQKSENENENDDDGVEDENEADIDSKEDNFNDTENNEQYVDHYDDDDN
ncbi:MAG: hypothetical protein ACI93R_002432 [Flavobacteriales bacterium]|jgi:hypothetical protein